MTDSFLILIFVVVLALLFDFFHGWHDGANAVAAVVSTRVLSPGRAVLTAAVLNGAGAFMSTAMAKMVGGEIVEASVITHRMVIAASVGAIAWKMVTLFLGFPTSSSHALLGGLIGAALSQDGMAAVKFSGLRAVLEALLFSPIIGFVLGYLIIVAIYWAMLRITGGVANKLFCRIQVISAGLMAFSHGSNDVQKVMGIITLALVPGGFLDRVEIQN